MDKVQCPNCSGEGYVEPVSLADWVSLRRLQLGMPSIREMSAQTGLSEPTLSRTIGGWRQTLTVFNILTLWCNMGDEAIARALQVEGTKEAGEPGEQHGTR